MKKWDVIWKSSKKETLEGETIQDALQNSTRKFISIDLVKEYNEVGKYKAPKIVEVEVFDLPNPADHYLKLVLGRFGEQWGTWLRNDSTGGYSYGHYYDLEKDIREDLKDRKVYYNIK